MDSCRIIGLLSRIGMALATDLTWKKQTMVASLWRIFLVLA